jgi:hypothetical protein
MEKKFFLLKNDGKIFFLLKIDGKKKKKNFTKFFHQIFFFFTKKVANRGWTADDAWRRPRSNTITTNEIQNK